jgi:glyoxylase-like metal-dependent hydrolase (beta-lactamase superfamily II)
MKTELLELKSEVKGQEVILHFTLLEVNSKLFLVDCGYEETFEDLKKVLRARSIEISDLDGILISHDDIDHIGALNQLKKLNPAARVMASHIEEPSLSGQVKSERLQQAEQLFVTLPDEHKEWALQFQKSLRAIKRVPIDRKLYEGELIENEIQVVHTPGHTKGHISFYIPALKLLIANDALVIEDNEFNIANPQFTLDMQAALNSIRKLQLLDIQKVFCFHGGEYKGNIKAELQKLLDKYEHHL